MKVALFDYGVGNLHSLGKALEAGGAELVVTDDWEAALSQEALVLPGVGAFDAAARALPDDRAMLREALEAGLPTLGICLGMQLLFDSSEEGMAEGIGVIPGRVRRIRASVVPQMGWNEVETADDPIFEDARGLVAYYANSFVCEPDDPADAIGWSRYESDRFVCAVRRGNVWGAQFHPEKSSHPGRRMILNFLDEARRIRGIEAAPDAEGNARRIERASGAGDGSGTGRTNAGGAA